MARSATVFLYRGHSTLRISAGQIVGLLVSPGARGQKPHERNDQARAHHFADGHTLHAEDGFSFIFLAETHSSCRADSVTFRTNFPLSACNSARIQSNLSATSAKGFVVEVID
jgi:hypothetical protein